MIGNSSRLSQFHDLFHIRIDHVKLLTNEDFPGLHQLPKLGFTVRMTIFIWVIYKWI
jgi:hypothetical protein